jgi:hypothetical protein
LAGGLIKEEEEEDIRYHMFIPWDPALNYNTGTGMISGLKGKGNGL